ncbi:MAG: hypothetical protein GF330_05865 [Candidatus Eisenbacteria bacterium]|nr:hypothetical protein [Candidatus Eisenbacteria bacterium]
MRMVINGREIEKEIADYEPCIYQLRVDSHGRLWVTHSRSVRDLSEGIMISYDVFDPDGRYAQRVQIACEGSAESDHLHFVGEDRVVLVRGASEQMIASIGPGGGGAAEVSGVPLEVICYRVPS